MKQILIFIAIGVAVAATVWLLVRPGDVAAPVEPNRVDDQAPDTATVTPVVGDDEGDQGAVAFPEAVVTNVFADIITRTSYVADEVSIESVTEQTWPNGCLGLAEPDEMCTEALVSGYEVRAEVNGNTFVYRTDSTGAVVRRAE